MKTIIWKEIRENLKWAALALLCLTLAEIYALYEYRNRFFTFRGDFTLCNSDFLFVSAVGCALVGAALGAIQILPELRRDQWAALLHRPVPRSTIFFGKVAAGLLLYLPATLVPLLLSVVYVNIPGQFGVPFVPSMVLPAVSDLLLGSVTYFAALLVSLSQGPWYGKRALLALSVVPLIVFHFVMGWFSPLLIAAAIFMMAAHSTMMSHGAAGKEPRMGRICCILVLFAGVEAVLFLVIAALSFLPHAGENIPPGFMFRDFRVADTGRVFISEINLTTSERKLTDSDGKPVADERYVGNNGPNPFCYLTELFPDRRLPRALLEQNQARHRRSGYNYFELVDGTFDEDLEAWYLDIQGNYFIGYDKVSRLCVGICDREGFHKAGTSPRPFSERINIAWSLNHPPRFRTGNQVYRVNFLERTMSLLFNSGAETIYSAVELAPPPMRKEVYEAVALKKEVRILDWNGAPLVIIPYNQDVDRLASINITTPTAGDRIFLEYVSARRDRANPREIPPPSLLEEIDFSGKIVRSYSTVVTDPFRREPGWLRKVTSDLTPLASVAIYNLFRGLFPNSLPAAEDSYIPDSSPAPFSFGDPMAKLGFVLGLGAIAAAGAFLWARKAGLERTKALGWAAFVFVFGLAGLITFRLATRWPTRVSCPNCSHQRPIETEECPSCHQTWPPPKSSGTEIFADSTC